MSFGSRLRDKRKELGITQPALAEKLGVSQSAIGSWETDVNSPRATLLYDLFDILHCDANYLFQDETKQLYKNEASPEEFENIIKKYRELDAHGKDMVDTVLQKEYDHIIELRDSAPQTEESSEESDNITTIDVLAAHARTDVEQTPEGVQHDLDIMDDDSMWD
ncbi:MAG: helix-turn-helix transcriptional regulator [Ruminococcus sp.]|nr:helix-turn-helix transcriptional regulator [Ruminococcus sp.]